MYVITYDHPHRRTEELVLKLLMQGIKPELLLVPWESRKTRKPLVDLEKPPSLSHPREYCGRMGMSLKCIDHLEGYPFDDGSRFLVGGAGLLPKAFVEGYEVINAHPGKIPKVRGLDALKWAIYFGDPIGVTLHRVDRQTDMGEIITYTDVKLYPNDTIHSIADRLWYMQITMLVWVATQSGLSMNRPSEPSYEPHRRMAAVEEEQMMKRLESRLEGISDL